MNHQSSDRHLAGGAWSRFFPTKPRDFPYRRTVRIALRTLHIITTGTLLGGYIFRQSSAELLPWLWGSVISGLLLLVTDLHASVAVLCELRGIAVITKVLLMLLIPVLWEARIPLLLTALVIGAVSSHMPRRYRHMVVLFPGRFTVDRRKD